MGYEEKILTHFIYSILWVQRGKWQPLLHGSGMLFGIWFLYCGVTGTEASGANPTADLLGGWGSYLNRWSGLV